MWFWLINGYSISNNPDDWAKLGDYFGGVTNSIFTFLTLITVVITLYYQRKELALTRRELQASRKVAILQEESLKSQAKAQHQTVFESAFTQMIEIHFKLLDSYQTGGYSGSQYFNNCLSNSVTQFTNSPADGILNSLDRRMHRHLFHLASIIDLIDEHSFGMLDDQNRFFGVLYNILSEDLLQYIKIAKKTEHYQKIQKQLNRISNFG
ncbi:hypothetical protein LFX25_20015 [Leptospira sp. FAT2]|uniref:hypothetical protein n=1 Tax=Leptospira sanjuanensis TaxID=2879643 RepID=UPI001EE95D36|nr:hypothetical protein [Leptospira sanjuanensis]MCG6170166.1 hypothetical protein [Leptospira sanjuanensis]MCG6195531.1 hypothetical protein [Leptospira sanjuanensis]